MTRAELLALGLVLACSAERAAPAAAPAERAEVLEPAAAPGAFEPASPAEIEATSGVIEPLGGSSFAIRSPTLRARLGRARRPAAELSFVYVGPTRTDAPLASGELRRQIGLELRAQDSCNVLYVMWHIEPTPALRISVKRNPGQSRHAECRDHGYRFLEPARALPPPPIRPGEPHVLRAEIRGRALFVSVDGHGRWEGELPPEAFEIEGPVGLRSDNGEFRAELRAERRVSE